ncbi:hypothetical protein OH710_24575 [Pseudomonas capsici]|uniref:hypothetical protein n=1 Tax=Pseudomonas capsici TaxID=2810614 RepID=UPI000F3F46B5|nr:hypothetical protein [Pseudomonas capsici]MCV4275821.1 hypothetical protein [Pseudomonas capsici]RMO09400.1 hypothetical protein ALQ47_02895 [Pseudomonas cichorii]
MPTPNYSVASPLADESFSSWCHRLQPRTAAQWLVIDDTLNLQNDSPTELRSRDPDFEMLSLFESRIKDAYGLKKAAFFERFRADCRWVVPHTVADHACDDCIADALRTHGRIVLLKSWRYLSGPICPEHSRMLTDYGQRDPSYLQFLTGTPVPLRLDITGTALAAVVKAGLKMQTLMLKLEKQVVSNPHSAGTREFSIFQARKYIMEFLLHAAHCGAGIATQFITTPRAINGALTDMRFKLLMKVGALQANAAERTCALIMMGIITGCVSRQEIEDLNNQTESGRSWWACRWDPESLGRSCNQIYASHDRTYSLPIRNALAAFNHKNTKAFIKGMALAPI